MNLRTNIDQIKAWAHRPTPTTRTWGFPLNLFYWLAGARRSTLNQLPESERERIAILGSSVMIPTLLGFFGMYLYASSRFQSSRPFITVLIALTWAFIIMNVDRILMATYRPFQSRRRKALQVCFRIGLAAVISVAIAFPFCLEQYQGAIRDRLQGEYRQRLDTLQNQERSERDLISQRDGARVNELRAQLDTILTAGPAEPALYAEELAKQQVQQRVDTSRSFKQQLNQEASKALEEWKQISAQMRVVDQDLKDEARGRLAAERGGTGKPGQGAKFRELSRDMELMIKAEQAARVRYEQLLARSANVQPTAPPKDRLSSLEPEQRDHFLAEAKTRAQRIDQLTQTLASAEQERAEHLAGHRLRFDPVIKSYTAKSQGNFDPMEETIGLFKVIFVPESGNDTIDPIVQQYKWIAALFQFSIIFGTLFLLDLIAILSKVMSRPGPYDVMVEFPELVAARNLEALRRQYPHLAETWASGQSESTSNAGASVDLRNSEEVARLLLTAHLPMERKSRAEEPSEHPPA
ncbi:MAG: DUF4407 domain-containing protein [Desulfobulbus sp.]|nr:DUF4407 domain-containing protein [Desulfobulbus sp.]